MGGRKKTPNDSDLGTLASYIHMKIALEDKIIKNILNGTEFSYSCKLTQKIKMFEKEKKKHVSQ